MVVDLISSATKTLDIAVYSINNDAIMKAIFAANASKVKIRVLTDHTQAGSNYDSTVAFHKSGIPFKLHSVNRIMHNKFAVADNKVAMNGSFNWTQPAQNANAENCVVFHSPAVVAEYEKQFDQVLWPENTQEKSDDHLKLILHPKKGK
jgi:phosphatidylserine/phosphatidylglycerophosphate/cardiolipin synthase-like enzyme